MKKENILLLSGLSILLAACGPSQNISVNPATQNKAEQVKQASKLSDIIANGGNAACNITNLTDPKENTTMVISGKKMKISGGTIQDGKKGFIINDGTYTYIWSEDSKEGFKMKNPEEDKTKDQEENKLIPVVSKDELVNDYEDESKFKVECQTNVVKDTDFVPPITVKFTDPTELMRAIPSIPQIPTE